MTAETRDANIATNTTKWRFLLNVLKRYFNLIPIFILSEWFQCGLPFADPLQSDACALLKTACCDRKIGSSVNGQPTLPSLPRPTESDGNARRKWKKRKTLGALRVMTAQSETDAAGAACIYLIIF